MFKNIFRIQKEEKTDHIVVRRTKYFLYLLILAISFFLYLQIMYIVWLIQIPWEIWSSYWPIWNVFIIASIWIFIFIRYTLIAWMISYFYSITILTPKKVISIIFWLNFLEKVKTVELDKIVSISSSKKWFLQTVCNYWKITLRNANDMDISIEKIPKPKHIAEIIQKMKNSFHSREGA